MRYFTSDFHFGHANIIKYCNRPFANTQEMDRALTANWNSVVKPEDTIYHLGDFALTSPEYISRILQGLNGHKVSIKGNHDRSVDTMLKLGFQESVGKMELVLSDGTEVRLSHFPYYDPTNPFSKNHKQTTWEDNGGILLCGHVHKSWSIKNKMFNVGADQYNFTPISEDYLLTIIHETSKKA